MSVQSKWCTGGGLIAIVIVMVTTQIRLSVEFGRYSQHCAESVTSSRWGRPRQTLQRYAKDQHSAQKKIVSGLSLFLFKFL